MYVKNVYIIVVMYIYICIYTHIYLCMCTCVCIHTPAAAKSLQSGPTLCDPIDSRPPGPPSLGFSRQEHWSGLPFSSPMHESEKWKWSRSVASTLSNPMDCSLSGFAIHGIFQAKELEWGATAFSTHIYIYIHICICISIYEYIHSRIWLRFPDVTFPPQCCTDTIPAASWPASICSKAISRPLCCHVKIILNNLKILSFLPAFLALWDLGSLGEIHIVFSLIIWF